MNEAIVIFGFICIFVISEVLLRINLQAKESARKLTHMSSGIFTLFAPSLISYASIVWLAALFAVVLLLLQGNPLLSSITTAERRTYGTWLMPLGISAAAFLYPSNHLFLPAIAILTFADGLAGIVGRSSPKKTAEGSLAFFLVSFCILAVSLSAMRELSLLSLLQSILIALILTIIERLSRYGTDNLFLPIAAGALLLFTT